MLRPARLLVLFLTLAPANVFAFDHHHHSGHSGHSSSGGCGGSHTTSHATTPTPSTATPPLPTSKRVFVTRATTDGNLGGTAGADAFCQSAADTAGLGGSYQAWLSTGTTNASDRLSGEGPWDTASGELAFDGRPDVAGPPLVDLTDAHGAALAAGAVVWTGSDDDGRAAGSDCSRWTATAATTIGSVGDARADSAHWGGGAGARPCNTQASLVCFAR